MVHGDEQHVLFVSQHDQAPANQGSVFKIERQGCFSFGQLFGLLRCALYTS